MGINWQGPLASLQAALTPIQASDPSDYAEGAALASTLQSAGAAYAAALAALSAPVFRPPPKPAVPARAGQLFVIGPTTPTVLTGSQLAALTDTALADGTHWNPGVPGQVSVTTLPHVAAFAAGSAITIAGNDREGNAITETLALTLSDGEETLVTAQTFYRIAQITIPAQPSAAGLMTIAGGSVPIAQLTPTEMDHATRYANSLLATPVTLAAGTITDAGQVLGRALTVSAAINAQVTAAVAGSAPYPPSFAQQDFALKLSDYRRYQLYVTSELATWQQLSAAPPSPDLAAGDPRLVAVQQAIAAAQSFTNYLTSP